MDNQHTQGQEETMLGLLWNHPELIISVWGIINEDDFMGEKTREFYAFLASLYQQHISGQSKILAIVPPGLQETIASARKRIEESTDSADLVKTAVQCAVRIKKSRLLQINVELTLKIDAAVHAGDSATVQQLTKQLTAAQRELRTLYSAIHLER